MSPLNATTFCAFALTTIALYILGFFPFIPAWAVFIPWACFFHMDGGVNPKQAFFANILHLSLGVFAAWLSAIALIFNPFDTAVGAQLWGPVLIGVMIAVLSRMGTLTSFCVTPAVIYGYAGTFAFLTTPGMFSIDHLLSLSFNNALITMLFSIVLGTGAAYLNAMLVGILCSLNWKRPAGTLPDNQAAALGAGSDRAVG